MTKDNKIDDSELAEVSGAGEPLSGIEYVGGGAAGGGGSSGGGDSDDGSTSGGGSGAGSFDKRSGLDGPE